MGGNCTCAFSFPQSVIVAMATLKKSHLEDDAVSCLVVASESCDVYILDPEAFTVLAQVLPHQPPVHVHSSSNLAPKHPPTHTHPHTPPHAHPPHPPTHTHTHTHTQMMLPSVPVFLSVTGLYEVEYQICAACRDACVYTIKRLSLSSMI